MPKKSPVDKARALLERSQDTSNENEAMMAARQLHAFLAQHNLKLRDLDAEDQESPGEHKVEFQNWPWRRQVAKAVAELYFCKFYYQMTRKNHALYVFVGTESNRSFAKSIVEVIFTTIENEARRESRSYRGRVVSSFVSSFRNGSASRISQRCKEMRIMSSENETLTEDGSTLPVLASLYQLHDAANENFINSLSGMSTKTIKKKALDREAYQSGVRAGNKVQLARGLRQTAKKQAILGISYYK